MTKHNLATLATLILSAATLPAQTQSTPTQHWYRGNTHTHSLNSDGDSPPDSLARWYRDHGYAFLFITDHEKITDPAPLNGLYGKPGSFLLIAGQEVTQRVVDSAHADKKRQAHVNGLGVGSVVMPLGTSGLANGITMREGYARNIAAIRAAGGIAQVNHPNFRWSVRLSDLVDLPDSTLLEIANAHTGVNNRGAKDADGRDVPSTEALWDSLLSRGKLLFAVGDDDEHSLLPKDNDEYELTRPGRSWVMVRADALTADAIVRALHRGDFYASTGVTLREQAADTHMIRVVMDAPTNDDRRFTTEFVGKGGRVLATVAGREAEYHIRGDEGYVRARITDSNGYHAWTQPVVVPRAGR
ncbi:MAG: CehA/McbA family metallohydrolase [bacterium]